jgi:hypothetical protein
MTNLDTLVAVLVAALFVALAAILLIRGLRPKQSFGPELAFIVEDPKLSGSGLLGVILMIGFNVVSTIGALIEKGNVLQEISTVLVWIGWNQIFAVMILTGRRRHYVVHRAPEEADK